MVAQLANDPMLAAILSGVNRTPQPYSISWPDTSANNYFPANAPIHAGSGANTAGLPPPIQSPSRFPSLPDATLTNAGSSTDANGLPLTPYRRMSKDTAAISQNVDALQAAIEQLVKNLPPEAQAQVLNSAGAYNGNNGDGNNGVGTDGIDWSSVLGGATGTQQAPDANLGDYFNTDAFLQNYGEGELPARTLVAVALNNALRWSTRSEWRGSLADQRFGDQRHVRWLPKQCHDRRPGHDSDFEPVRQPPLGADRDSRRRPECGTCRGRNGRFRSPVGRFPRPEPNRWAAGRAAQERGFFAFNWQEAGCRGY